ncbi:MAG: hypothetical protein KGQ79_05895 [Proteobacteria bacterium]|nr:hypothetical protein [Pseudomonadota bacterium]
MDMTVQWSAPIPLYKDKEVIYWCDLEKIPETPGVYIFGRVHGESFEAFYVGKGIKLKRRIEQHFINNVYLMKKLENAQNGTRVVMVGEFIAASGQQAAKCIGIIERALIRHFMSDGHDLVNVQGTALKHHSVNSTGAGKKLPRTILLEKPSGQKSNSSSKAKPAR